ncbi:MAG: hypothetical protein JWL77_3906 [Chthonomonadaceae bacterium]|nr:hypothetical protein [Chthonomonadaceae bacterium]
MAILRKSSLALAAMFCLGVAVPVFAQGGADKTATDIKAAQGTLTQLKALGAEIKARQASAMAGTATPVAAPVVRRTTAVAGETKTPGKKAGAKKAPAKKKKNP